ncbi:hypothetical protein [Nonomuraea roseoviolacea]|uniref:FtsH-binding integral membrane protein n=1 Tax=Nonomuraea roseoviolacea subsp. carminata TaxID=160689 RepID=A0ABT1K0X0_9ACTN|nr:hypothetical protein [Nonomuraea roseoviolacea]MCP2347136.1 FtsH-binding integral membrane protein [Nonomuraea roseoviolacea subsp. carminata]
MRFIVTLQCCLWLLALALSLGPVVMAGGAAWILPVVAAAWAAVQGWALRRVPGRLRSTRWLLVAIEAAQVVMFLALRAADGDFDSPAALFANVSEAVVAVVLLLLPAAGRWFDRPRDAVHLSAPRTSDG